MRITILRDCGHRITSGLSLQFRAGSQVSVPRAIGEALVGRGVAEAVTAGGRTKPAIEET